MTPPASKPRERGRRKGPPLAPLSTSLSEVHTPVYRLSEEEQLELSKHHDSRSDTLSQITPWLFLGSLSDATDKNLLRKYKISCILNTAKECDSGSDSSGGESPDGYDVEYRKLELVDDADESISHHFFTAFEALEAWRKQDRKVLVHCRRGISRSATLVIAYLMQYESRKLQDAYNHVLSCRSIINPNLGFVLSLENFAQELGHQAHHLAIESESHHKINPVYNQPIAC